MGLSKELEHIGAMIANEVELSRLKMSAGLAESINGLRVGGASYWQVSTTGLVYGGARRLIGWSFTATGGAVTVTLLDGRSADATDVVAAFVVPSGGDAQSWRGPQGVTFVEGLFAVVTGTGTLTGAVHLGAVD